MHPLARAEHRHAAVVLVPQPVRLSFLDDRQGPHHHLGLLVPVGRAGLVALTPEGVAATRRCPGACPSCRRRPRACRRTPSSCPRIPPGRCRRRGRRARAMAPARADAAEIEFTVHSACLHRVLGARDITDLSSIVTPGIVTVLRHCTLHETSAGPSSAGVTPRPSRPVGPLFGSPVRRGPEFGSASRKRRLDGEGHHVEGRPPRAPSSDPAERCFSASPNDGNRDLRGPRCVAVPRCVSEQLRPRPGSRAARDRRACSRSSAP